MKEETKVEILKVAAELARLAIEDQSRGGEGKRKDTNELFLHFVTVVKEQIIKIA